MSAGRLASVKNPVRLRRAQAARTTSELFPRRETLAKFEPGEKARGATGALRDWSVGGVLARRRGERGRLAESAGQLAREPAPLEGEATGAL